MWYVTPDMKRAVELFEFERRPSESPLIADTWETQSGDDEDSFLSVAATNWEMVVTRQQGSTWLVVRGPETYASVAPVPLDAEFFGIQFSLGTFMPGVRLRGLVGKGLVLPPMSEKSFWLDGAEWDLPQAHNADVFVDRLVRAGLLFHDPVVPAALADDTVDGLSTRSVERRVARATGLTRGTIQLGRPDFDRRLHLVWHELDENPPAIYLGSSEPLDFFGQPVSRLALMLALCHSPLLGALRVDRHCALTPKCRWPSAATEWAPWWGPRGPAPQRM